MVVVDNASYHNVQLNRAPTSGSTSAEMKRWLAEKNITCPPSSLKPDLYDLSKTHKPSHIKYKIDNIFETAGHTGLRLPPYHPDLNPIEMIWGTVKKFLGQKNVTFKLDDAMRLAQDKFESISSEEWIHYVNKVKAREEEYFSEEAGIDARTENPVISTEDSDDSVTSDDDE